MSDDHGHDMPTGMGTALGAKIATLVLFAVITLACGLLPLVVTWLARRCGKTKLPGRRRRRWTELLVSCVMCLGGGVLIATIFLHMLPEIRELFESAEMMGYVEDIGIPLGETLLCVGFFMVFFLEQVAHAIMSHGHRRKQKAKHAANGGIENPAADITEGDEDVPSQSTGDQNPIDVDEHDHEVEAVAQKSFRAYLVVLALSVHSIFEGLAVGFEDTAEKVWILFFALLAHKVIVAFCIGQQLLNTKRSICFVIGTFSIFGFATPIGVGIGTAISDASMGAGTLVATGVLQSLAAGTIMYVIFFELLGHEMQKKGGGLIKFLAALLGFGLMLLVHTTGEHGHSHGGHPDAHGHGHPSGTSVYHAGDVHGQFGNHSVEDVIRGIEEKTNLDRNLDHNHGQHEHHELNHGPHELHGQLEHRELDQNHGQRKLQGQQEHPELDHSHGQQEHPELDHSHGQQERHELDHSHGQQERHELDQKHDPHEHHELDQNHGQHEQHQFGLSHGQENSEIVPSHDHDEGFQKGNGTSRESGVHETHAHGHDHDEHEHDAHNHEEQHSHMESRNNATTNGTKTKTEARPPNDSTHHDVRHPQSESAKDSHVHDGGSGSKQHTEHTHFKTRGHEDSIRVEDGYQDSAGDGHPNRTATDNSDHNEHGNATTNTQLPSVTQPDETLGNPPEPELKKSPGSTESEGD